MRSIAGVSHVELCASSSEQYVKLLEFYTLLGFKLVQTRVEGSVNSQDSLVGGGSCGNIAAESWMHLFCPTSSAELSLCVRQVNDTNSTTPSNSITTTTTTTATTQSTSGKPVAICMFTERIRELELELTNFGVKLERNELGDVMDIQQQQQQQPRVELELCDPVGTVVRICSYRPRDPSQVATGSPILHPTAPPPSAYNNNMSSHGIPDDFSMLGNGQSRTPTNALDILHESPLFQLPPGVKRLRRKIAIVTSGGDAPGMNSALRSIVRIALLQGCVPFAVMDGYKGLVGGGKMIKELRWGDVQGILHKGGTIIGTARCVEFREKEGRRKAVRNLIKLGIDALVVIGGDGSLTGADCLRSEWQDHIKELLARGEIMEDDLKRGGGRHLSIVGLVGSIDNDMSGTDLTIGAVSSLHRICEAVDSISSTATSHQRAFVIEVMGRNCGWLAVMAAISNGADWLFIPEDPPSDGWEEEICRDLNNNREMGKRKSIIIVAEGAVDRNLKPIRAEYIKDLIAKKAGMDARVTTLGHVQRGGVPAAMDRYLGTIQGVKAVEAVLSAGPESEAPVVSFCANQVVLKPLMRAVEMTRSINEAIKNKQFSKALEMRDYEFRAALGCFKALSGSGNADLLPEHMRMKIAIVHCGAPAGGMNTATRAAALLACNRGHTPVAIHNGFAGLMAGDVRPIDRLELDSLVVEGGSAFGTNRIQPVDDLGLCAFQLQKHNIQALLVIGGFEAFTALIQLGDARKTYPAFCIPMALLPATISNNVPGTELSLGADTALNVIIEACDRIRQSAFSSRKRVFVVEVQGGNCGFLATLAALECGATCAYIPEIGIDLRTVARDCSHLIRQFRTGENQGRVILRNENASDTYTTEVISSIFREEGQGVFDSRTAILGHTQQGGQIAPMDRVRATRLAVNAVHWFEQLTFPAMLEKHSRRSVMATNGGPPTVQNALLPNVAAGGSVVSPVLYAKHHRHHPSHNINNYVGRDGAELAEDEARVAALEAATAAALLDETRLFEPSRSQCIEGSSFTSDPCSVGIIGVHGTDTYVTPVQALIKQADFKKRTPKHAWWKHLNGLVRVLAKYGFPSTVSDSSDNSEE